MKLPQMLEKIKPCEMDKPFIFVSYSSKDSERVWRDVLELQALGYNIWLDEKNLDKTNESWKIDALEAIEDYCCTLLVFYVSRHSLVSEACYNELAKTLAEETKEVHGESVKFIAIDAEPVGIISDFEKLVRKEIFKKSIGKAEKTMQARVLSRFMDERFFGNNNERVRILSKNESQRKSDYYHDIVASLPEETRIHGADETYVRPEESVQMNHPEGSEGELQRETAADSMSPNVEIAELQAAGLPERQQTSWIGVQSLPERIGLNGTPEFCTFDLAAGWSGQRAPEDLTVSVGCRKDGYGGLTDYTINFNQDGNLLVYGAAGTGKSVFLQSLMYALIRKYTPEEVQLYALDFSSGQLTAFEKAPHFGGVIAQTDQKAIGRFLRMLQEILAGRKELLAGENFVQYQQRTGKRLPAIVTVIDNYAVFKGAVTEEMEQQMYFLTSEGISKGIFFAVSVNDASVYGLGASLRVNFRNKICFSLNSPDDYSIIYDLRKMPVVPDRRKRGRGIGYQEYDLVEFQAALSEEEVQDYSRMAMIRDVCETMARVWTKETALPIPYLPEVPVWSQFSALPAFREAAENPGLLPIGYDYETAQLCSIPLYATYCYLVCGERKSGKTNFLKVCAQSALQKKGKVVIITPAQSAFAVYADDPDVMLIHSADELYQFYLGFMKVIKERSGKKNQLITEGKDDEEVFEGMSQEKPFFILIQDFSWFISILYEREDKRNLAPFTENLFQKGELLNIYIFAEAGNASKAMLVNQSAGRFFVSHKAGIHFGGNMVNNNILEFQGIPYREMSASLRPGLGVRSAGYGETVSGKVMVPLAGK